MSTELELRLFHRQDLECALLPAHEVQRVFGKLPSIVGDSPKTGDVENYLRNAHDDLFKREKSWPELRQEYLTSASIYAFAQPLLFHNLDPTYLAQFKRIIRRSPYSLEQPLLLFIDGTEAVHEHEIDEEFHARLVHLEMGLVDGEHFDRSGQFNRTLQEKRRFVAGKLRGDYHEADHFTFIGLHDVCIPLFGDTRHGEEYKDLHRTLEEQNGTYYLPIPSFLANNTD